MTRLYGFTETNNRDDDLTIWTGPFMSTHEGTATYTNGTWTITLDYREPITLDGPGPRNNTNWETVDRLLNQAINQEQP